MKRSLTAVAATAAALLVLASCAPGGTTSQDPQPTSDASGVGTDTPSGTDPASGGGEITVWHYWDGANADAFDDAAAKYSSEHPDVKINAVNVPGGELMTKLQTSAQTGTLPTIAIMDLVSVAQINQTGKLADLTGLLPDSLLSDIPPQLLTFGALDGKQVSVPVSTNNIGYMWNKDMFEAAGLDPNTPPTTWEEVKSMGAEILAATGKPSYELFTQAGDNGEGLTWNFQVNLWQAGGQFLNEDSSAAAFNSDAGKQALQFWVDLIDAGISPLTSWGEFEKGNAAAAPEGAWMVGIWQNDPPFDFGAAKMPHPANGTPATNMGGEQAVVFDSADNQAAADFLAWFLDSEQALTWSKTTGMMPVTNAVATSSDYTTFVADTQPLLLPYVEQIPEAHARPSTPLYPAISLAFATEIEKALNGSVTVDEALANAETAVNDVIAKG